MGHVSEDPDGLRRAVHEVIKAIQVEEAALSNLLSWEKELFQKVKGSALNLGEFITANESVCNVMRNMAKLQMMTQLKLHFVEELLLKLEDEGPHDALGE